MKIRIACLNKILLTTQRYEKEIISSNTTSTSHINNTNDNPTSNNASNNNGTERSDLSEELLLGKSKRNVQILNTIEDLLTLDMNEPYIKIVKTIARK